MTPEALEPLGRTWTPGGWMLKVFYGMISIKAVEGSHWEEYWRRRKRAKNKWNMHLEVITNIIPTMNDDDEPAKG
jgi:pyruvate formate lyase activating enzyme